MLSIGLPRGIIKPTDVKVLSTCGLCYYLQNCGPELLFLQCPERVEAARQGMPRPTFRPLAYVAFDLPGVKRLNRDDINSQWPNLKNRIKERMKNENALNSLLKHDFEKQLQL